MSFTRCLCQAIVVAAAASAAFADQRVELTHLPAAVQQAVHDQTRGATLVGLSKERQRGRVVYEVETTINGRTRDVILSATGAVVVVEEEVALETLPAEVAAALTTRGTVLKVEMVTTGTTVTYEAQVAKRGKTTEVTVDAHGRIPRRTVTARESAAILGIAGAVSLSALPLDERVTHRASTSAALDHVFEVGAFGGSGVVQIGGALATYAVGRGSGQRRVAIVGADLVRAQILTGVLTQGLKVSVGRHRPDGGRYSFPSGHTSTSFATAAVLQRHGGWRLGLPAYAFGVYVAGSRLQENRHYLSDVVFGAGLGIVSGRAVSVGRGRGAGVVQPVVTRDALGLAFTLTGAR